MLAPLPEMLAETSHSAVHLEMRDVYEPSNPDFQAWQRGDPVNDQTVVDRWHGIIGDAVARGVEVRRARIVSEQLSEYARFAHWSTGYLNIDAGEDVRWLPRARALDLCLPGCDFWLLDDATLRVAHFSGDGELVGHDVTTDAALIKHCSTAFEAIWDRAIPHRDYTPST